MIQWNINIFNDGKTPSSGIKLRDDETEGYNIIPNFFISATMDEKYRYNIDGIKETDRKNNRYMSKQFQNRLFDRDTLLLFHYDVNFLFVLSLYARNNKGEQREWKENIRAKFRTEIQNWLQQDFEFYAMRPLPSVDVKEYMETHFRQVLGKVYTPFEEENVFSLALDKKEQKSNEALLDELGKSFVVRKCSLGTNPHDVLPNDDEIIVLPYGSDEKNILTCMVRKSDDAFKTFAEHKGKKYIMEKIPPINLMGIKYLLPMVGGMIDGYYDVQRIGILFTSLINDIINTYKQSHLDVKILVVAHRTELLDQISATLNKFGISNGFIQGAREQYLWKRVQVGSIMSLLTEKNYNNVCKQKFDYIIVDEAHHSLADTYIKLFGLFPKAKKLGVTATPWRLNHESFLSLYQYLIVSPQISWFISNHLLADFDYVSIKPDSEVQRLVDNSEVSTTGDFSNADLDNTFNNQRIRSKLYESYQQFANGRKGIIYAINKRHACC